MSCDKIAEILHKDGYNGDLETFKFGDNGMAEYGYYEYLRLYDGDPVYYRITADNNDKNHGILTGEIKTYSQMLDE